MKAQKHGWRFALVLIGLGLLAMMVMDFNSRTAELRRLSAEKEVVSAQATSVMQTEIALEDEIAYATSEPAVMQWAYEDGHMIRSGDVPVVPIAPQEVTPVPTPVPTVVVPQTSNWQRWLSLFVGPQAP
jgi:hypothetical protein